MEQWNFYLSGILYGVLEKRNSRVYHRPLDVYTGRLEDWQELKSGDGWYRELGKMDVLEALLGLEDYESGVRGCAGGTDGCKRFMTPRGELYEKKDTDAYVQRNIKFPKDLILESATIAAFVTPYRDQCAVLVRDGLEGRTILKQWADMNQSPLYAVKPPITVMIPMRDQVRLSADIYLPAPAATAGNSGDPAPEKMPERIPAVLIRTPYGKSAGASSYFRFVQRGYAVIIQDVRGREDSEGEWLPMYYEVEDGDDTLTWIGAQTWSDGNVGMTGGSYLGYVQWAAAASGNPHLKAMLSNVCAGSPFIDVPRRGGCFNSGMLAWAFMVSGQRANPLLMAREDWDEVLNIRPLPSDVNKLNHQACRTPLGEFTFSSVTSSGLVSTEELFLDLMNLALDSADVKCLMLLPFHQVYGNGVEEKLAGFFKDKNEEERGKAVYFITEEPLSPVYCRLEPVFYSLAHAFGIKSDEL